MKHLQDFRYLEAIMRAGSIRKAADDMNITASALNRRVQRLEEEFGYEIFERLPRGVRLNPAGEMLIQHFRTQQSDLRRVQSQVADLRGSGAAMSPSPVLRRSAPISCRSRSPPIARITPASPSACASGTGPRRRRI